MNRHALLGAAFIAVAMMFWGGNTTVGRFAMTTDLPPVGVNFWRWTMAFAILLPLYAPTLWRQRQLLWRHRVYCFFLGLVGVTCFNSFYYVGLQTTTAVQGSLIAALLPLLILVLGAVYAGTGITGRQVGGLVLSIGGAVLVVVRGEFAVLQTLRLNPGDFWCLAAVLCWAVQTFMLRYKPPEMDIMALVVASVGLGWLALVPAYAVETALGGTMRFDRETVLLVGYLGLFASVIAFSLYNAGVVRVGSTGAGYLGNLFPVFSALLAVIFLGEAIAWYHALGGMLVLGGIYLATVPPGALRRRPTARSAGRVG